MTKKRVHSYFDGRHLSGCEVCWTCLYYNTGYFGCCWPFNETTSLYAKNSLITVVNPPLDRCRMWRDRDEQKN